MEQTGTEPYRLGLKRPGTLRLLREDLRCYHEGALALGFWALVIHRFGHASLSIQPRWLRAPFRVLHIFFFKLSEILFGITLPAQATIGERFLIEHSGGIVVHGYAVIGDDCVIRQGVTIGMRTRERPFEAPRIGNRVEIGAGAKILGKINIGDDCLIGANSVVLQDMPPNTLAIGIPATLTPRRRSSSAGIKSEHTT